MKLRKRTLFTGLARLEREQRRLVREVNMPPAVYWLLTVFGAGGGAAVGKLLFSPYVFRRRGGRPRRAQSAAFPSH